MNPLLYRVQVLDRTCDILECLANNGPELGVSEITSDLGLSKTTVHRLLSALTQREFVQRVPASGKYRLGMKLFELGQKAGNADGLVASAGSYLTRLVSETGETAHLGVLREGQVVCLCAVESPKTSRSPAAIGERTPAHASSLGKCMLAGLSSGELTVALAQLSWERFTPRTMVSEEVLIKELQKVRQQGFAVDDEEFEQGIKCVAAPVRDRSGRVRAALGIAGPRSRLGPQVMQHHAATVVGLSTQSRKIP
ncbi:MAG: IclR family transcriptional regulator [Acidobacteria bacterium]|nr:IclR family transcriptional regulator [Acidobacteriota bacterium]MDA1236720.1 IclR family transcriptional regulator [Acidobacteriota bacterium]